jgi:hypothetical protein
MEQTQNDQNKKKKNRYLPFIWFFGLGLLGGLIVLALLIGKKNDQLKGLENQLTTTTLSLNHDKDALQNELQKVSSGYTDLKTTNESLNNKLNSQVLRNNGLASRNKKLSDLDEENRNKFNALIGSFDNLRNENSSLKSNLENEQSESNKLRSQLANYEDLAKTQKNEIVLQTDKYKKDSTQSVITIDSLVYESKLRFANITELNGGYGVYRRTIPYAHYFYGINNVTGFRINKHFIGGLGVGLLSYNGGVAIPLYLDFRYHFNQRKYTPYFWFDSGLELKFEDVGQPMLFINPGVGLYKSISDHFAVNLGAGVFIQRDILSKSTFANLKLGLIYIKGVRDRKLIR